LAASIIDALKIPSPSLHGFGSSPLSSLSSGRHDMAAWLSSSTQLQGYNTFPKNHFRALGETFGHRPPAPVRLGSNGLKWVFALGALHEDTLRMGTRVSDAGGELRLGIRGGHGRQGGADGAFAGL
jgi:hypothetical protein